MKAIVKTYNTKEDYDQGTFESKEKFRTIQRALTDCKKKIAEARKNDIPLGYKIFDKNGNIKHKLPNF